MQTEDIKSLNVWEKKQLIPKAKAFQSSWTCKLKINEIAN